MSNPGNTGQHYKMVKIIGAEKTTNGVRIKFACGHSDIITLDPGSDIDGWIAWNEERIQKGKRQRCNQCEVDSDAR